MFLLEGCGAFIISKKLTFLKANLRNWAKDNFGNSNLLTKNLLIELHSLDSLNEIRSLFEVEGIWISQIRVELHSLLKQEEIYWKQRSRITWLKEGDSNTKYFNLLENDRGNKNYIPLIQVHGQWVEGNQEIGNCFTNYFKQQIGTPVILYFLLDWQNLFAFKERVNLSHLELPFSSEEIKKALFDLNVDKAPGLDGFPLFFFQKH